MKKLFIITLAVSLFSFLPSVSKATCGMNAKFTYKISGDTVSFTDSSYTTGTKISRYYWSYGDSSATDSVQNPKHIFKYAGAHKIVFYVLDSGKKCYSSYRLTIYTTVGAKSGSSGCGITAHFTYKVSHDTVHFYDSSYTTGNKINKYYWNYGDSTTGGTTKNTDHIYKYAGAHTVIFYALDSTNTKCYSRYSITIYTTSAPKGGSSCSATAHFTYKASHDTVHFYDSSYTKSGKITKYYWSYGDSSTSGTTKNPDHIYAHAGAHTVVLYVFDSIGKCYASYKQVIYTTAASKGSSCGLNAHFTYKVSGDTVRFTDSSWSTGSKITKYYWNYGDSSTYGTTKNTDHIYKHAGSHTVNLYIADSGSKCYSHYSVTFTTGKSGGGGGTTCGLHAYFTYKISGGDSVRFTDSSWSTTAPVAGYYWSFGDKTTSTAKNPDHTYLHSGVDTVTLYVYDSAHKCYAHYTSIIKVTAGTTSSCGLNAHFTYKVSGDTVRFMDSSWSTGAKITKYYWVYGDSSTTGTTKNSDHIYAYPGAHTVILYIGDSSGKCYARYSTTIYTTGGHSKLYTISGRISLYSSKPLVDYGIAYLIYYNPTDSSLTLIDSVKTYSVDSGRYTFKNVKGGKYLVKGALASYSSHYKDYLPTYHVYSHRWDSATPVYVGPNAVANIYLRKGTNPGGPGFIGGKVKAGANKVGDPIPNVTILLFDVNYNPIGYTYSDASGNFDLSNLAYGTYIVYPEVLGKFTTPAYITICASAPSVNNLDIEVGLHNVAATVTGIESMQDNRASVQIYPNPVKDVLTMTMDNAKAGRYNIQVYDATGKMISANIIENTGGSRQATISTQSLPQGMYFLQINATDGSFGQHLQFIK